LLYNIISQTEELQTATAVERYCIKLLFLHTNRQHLNIQHHKCSSTVAHSSILLYNILRVFKMDTTTVNMQFTGMSQNLL